MNLVNEVVHSQYSVVPLKPGREEIRRRTECRVHAGTPYKSQVLYKRSENLYWSQCSIQAHVSVAK
jgi:hypothetical protein